MNVEWVIFFVLLLVIFPVANLAGTYFKFSEAQQCTRGQVLNPSNGKCECPPGKIYEPIDGACISGKSPSNKIPENAGVSDTLEDEQQEDPVQDGGGGGSGNDGSEDEQQEEPVEAVGGSGSVGGHDVQQPDLSENNTLGEQVVESNSNNVSTCLSNTGSQENFNMGSLTIRLIGVYDSTVMKTYRIWPNPYQSVGSLVMSEGDGIFDCDQRPNILTLGNVPIGEYEIGAIDRESGMPTLNFNFSVSQDLRNPIINLVKRELGTELPIRFIPNQFFLILKELVNDPYQVADDLASRYNVKIIDVYDGDNKGILVGLPMTESLDIIRKDPRIAFLEQNKIGRIASVEGQTTPFGIDRIGGDLYSFSYQDPMAGHSSGIADWNSSNSDVNVDVAILDTGISFEHPDLNVYRNVSFVPYTIYGDDDQGHGSHVAGIIGAKNNSYGVVGVAPGARLWAVKVCDQVGSCTTSNQVKGVRYVIDHADEIDVANISIENLYSPALNSAIKEAVLKGVTFIVASGNSFQNASNKSPANSPYVITVSAIADTDGKCGGYGGSTEYGSDDNFASFSNFGKVVDVTAPGVDILSTYNGTDYGLDSGTSMAAPHVTGIAALLKAEQPELSPSEVYNIVYEAASKPGALCSENFGGYFTGDVDNTAEPILQIPPNIAKTAN